MMCRNVLQSNSSIWTWVQSKVSELQRYPNVLQANLLDLDIKGTEPSVCIRKEI